MVAKAAGETEEVAEVGVVEAAGVEEAMVGNLEAGTEEEELVAKEAVAGEVGLPPVVLTTREGVVVGKARLSVLNEDEAVAEAPVAAEAGAAEVAAGDQANSPCMQL